MRIENKKAHFDYQIIEAFEAGIILTGAEVKSLRAGQGNLTGSRVVDRNGALWIIGMNVNKYAFATDPDYDPLRSRKILLHRKELDHILTKKESEGLTLVPLALYNKGDLIKVEVGLVRGKKQYEKRESIKKRTEERWLSRQLKKQREE